MSFDDKFIFTEVPNLILLLCKQIAILVLSF